MDIEFEKKYHAFEDKYWWFRARRDCLLRLIQRDLQMPPDAAILEIGCSGGPMLQALRDRGFTQLCGIDLSEAAIGLCRQRGFSDVHVMDATAPNLGDRKYDLLIASDVLEHIEQGGAALSNWTKLLRPGGKLLVFVPAFMFLWSQHDEVNRHFRRYTAGRLKQDLLQAGFEVRKTSYWNTTLFPLVAAVRLLKRAFTNQKVKVKDQLVRVNPLVNGALERLVVAENLLMTTGLRLPVGVSVMALCTGLELAGSSGLGSG